MSGGELAERAQLQARKFGAEMMVPCRAVGLSERDVFHLVALEDGDELLARSAILAAGFSTDAADPSAHRLRRGAGVAHAVEVVRAELGPGEAWGAGGMAVRFIGEHLAR